MIPVYNREKSIERCLKSILYQTYKNLDIIVIDDGSTDGTYEICEKYAAKDSRLRLIRQHNSGVSRARNNGIGIATGEWLTFVDSDDYITKNCIERMINIANKENSDMVVCDFYENGKYNKQFNDKNIDYQNFIKQILKGKIHGSCWNKMIRKDIVVNNGIYFDEEISYCEDILFNIRCCLKKIVITYLDEAFYHYEHGNDSNSLAFGLSENQYQSLKNVIKKLQYILPPDYSLKRQKEDAKRIAFQLNLPKKEVKTLYKEVNFDLFLKALPNFFGKSLDCRLVRYMYFD